MAVVGTKPTAKEQKINEPLIIATARRKWGIIDEFALKSRGQHSFMSNRSMPRFPLIIPAALLAVGLSALKVNAQTQMYNPVRLPNGNEITDTLTEKDIPTGFGGFARDYVVTFEGGDQVVMDLLSDEFDTIVTLIAPDGSTLGENDDGPDGTTNSLLFARISQPGDYIVRVRPYAGQGLGAFTLKVTRLRPIEE